VNREFSEKTCYHRRYRLFASLAHVEPDSSPSSLRLLLRTGQTRGQQRGGLWRAGHRRTGDRCWKAAGGGAGVRTVVRAAGGGTVVRCRLREDTSYCWDGAAAVRLEGERCGDWWIRVALAGRGRALRMDWWIRMALAGQGRTGSGHGKVLLCSFLLLAGEFV
jgi:hypothetical protein